MTPTPARRPALDQTDPDTAQLLAQRFAQFALDLDAQTDEKSKVLAHIVEGATKLIPGVRYAAVLTSLKDGRLAAREVVGDVIPATLLDLQNSVREGPCLSALGERRQIVVNDLSTESRWPSFTPAALEAGAVNMLCTPLVIGLHTLGVLTLIGTVPAFDEEAEHLAGIFAAHAAIALAGAQRHDYFNAALDSRDVIGQAKGILMERFRYTPDQAFAALVKASADNNIKLRAVCDQLCLTGALPTRPEPRSIVGQRDGRN